MTLKTRFRLVCLRQEDGFRYSRSVRALLAWLFWLRGKVARRTDAKIRHLTKALGLAESQGLWRLVMRSLLPLLTPSRESVWRHVVAALPRYATLLRDKPHLTRSVVLKAPGPEGEKGVLLNYFEYNLARVLSLSDSDLRWLDRHYHLVFVASWSPTDYALLGSALLRLESPLFIQCANEAERGKLAGFHPGLVCLPGLACDWVDPAFYQPKPYRDRSIDLLMVANWGAFKRHWEFFSALRDLSADLRVVLIGQKEGGRDKESITGLAREIGVPQKLEFFESLTIEQVTDLQCDSRVSVILSRREGGCVAAVESLFAGCALAMRSDAIIGSSAHINPQTGRHLRPGRIAGDLGDLLAECEVLKPREWALDRIRNDLTLARINALVEEHALASGQPWTQDLAVPRWRPHPTLANEADRERLRPAYRELHERFPSLFGADLMDQSHR
jgi:hypothetical protein